MNRKSILQRVIDRVFPKAPDFFALLSEQCALVQESVDAFVRFMESGDPELGKVVKRNEHEADKIKVRNIHKLNEAFSTPIDREDIYRAIMHMDDVVNYCKDTVNEMDVLGIGPNAYTLEMAQRIQEGVLALSAGFGRLGVSPGLAAADADAVRKAERRVEKIYRRALADLFQGDDYLHMFKRREIYRHLANAAERMADSANTLHDIVVKIT